MTIVIVYRVLHPGGSSHEGHLCGTPHRTRISESEGVQRHQRPLKGTEAPYREQ